MLHQTMKWEIHKISPNDESVYVINSRNGTIRQFSVPGAEDGWMVGNMLIIRCATGYFWEVEPDSGSRRRIQGQQPLI